MKVNEIFYSVQGEGHYTGTPAVFIRLSGCNLCCSFCDTQHESFTEMSEAEIVAEALAFPARHVVITGGEPTLQLNALLTESLHEAGFYIQIETNGSLPLAEGCEVDWITCSPKAKPVVLDNIQEIKLVYQGQDVTYWENYPAKEHRLQPLDTQDASRNAAILQSTFDYILEHPIWKLSLQTHKILNVR